MPVTAVKKAVTQNVQPSNTAPPPESAPQRSAESIRDDAAGRISQLQSNMRVRGGRLSRAQSVDMLSRVYERGGLSGVNQMLLANPRLVASLGACSRDEVETALGETIGSWDAGAVMESVQERVTLTLREGIRRTAQSRIREQVDQLSEGRDNLARELTALGEPPRDVQRATELGFLIQQADNAISALRTLSGRFDGQAWEVGDFPRTTVRLATRAGMGDLVQGTFSGEALRDTSGSDEAIAAAGLKIAEAIAELPHIAHALAHEGAALGSVAVGVFVGGVALGLWVHHEASECREELIATGRQQLGL